MKIKIKYLVDGLEPVEQTDRGDWVDLRAAVDVKMKSGEHRLIPLGIAMELPEGYEGIIVPKNNTLQDFHILMSNSTNIIQITDQIFFHALAIDDTEIYKNDIICKFKIQRVPLRLTFKE